MLGRRQMRSVGASIALLLAGVGVAGLGRPAHAAGEPDLAQARDAIAHGRYAEGVKALDGLLATTAGKAQRDVRSLLIQARLETGEYARAVAEADELAKQAPDDPGALTLSAQTLIETGRYDEAGQRLARALEIDKAHLEARLLSLELAEIAGKRDAIDGQVSYFFTLYSQGGAKGAKALTAVARAVENDDAQGAWRAYQEAMQADPNYVEAYILGGFHCLDKYAWGLARRTFDGALKLNPNLAIAHVGIASLLLSNSKYDEAVASIDQALKVNPRLPLAHLLKASMLAVDEKHAESLAEIRAALAVNPHAPQALALLAAHFEALGDAAERDKAIAQTFAINPNYAELYATLAVTSERLRRCPAAVAWARKAIELDPKYWRGYYLAGMNLLRAGEEQEGYKLLDQAFRLNDFNVWAFNMLTVLDRDFKRHQFAYHETPHFFVKLDKTEDAILWPYIELLLEPAYEKLTRAYAVTPQGPKEHGGRILVLIFPDHSEFSARTVGLPGLGALGACLGQVITMPSPRFGLLRRDGPFNWRQVLLHEFLHVLTLQKTRYNIPRWLTEGLSVMVEDDTRAQWDPLLVRGIARNELLPIEDLNSGFTRPKFPYQVPLSYYEAMLICRDFQETYGFPAIVKMLDLYGEGRQTRQVLPQVTGKTIEQLDKQAFDYIRRFASQIKLHPPIDKDDLAALEEKLKKDDGNAELWTELAAGRLAARQAAEARKAANRAIEINPRLARAQAIVGLIAYAIDHDAATAKKHFLLAKEADPNAFAARLQLGIIAEEQGQTEEAIAELEAARKIYPRFQATGKGPHERLAALYAKVGKRQRAIEVLRELVSLDASAYAAHVQLAELLNAQEQPAEAAAAYLEAFYVNPFDAKVHLAAARTCEAAKAPLDAVREYGVALAIEPRSIPALVGRARALAAAGRTDEAREAVDAIRKVDPTNPEALGIERSLKK